MAELVEVTDDVEAKVGRATVRRALPCRRRKADDRRTIGAWCFADHIGPVAAEVGDPGIGPHPHIGLQTVTYLLEGRLLHRDSVGSEQLIRPGQVNLMTAGRGVVHAEEPVDNYDGRYHGMQLWVAMPEETRHDPPAFEHHRELAQLELGYARLSVLAGELHGARSRARTDTELVGADLVLRGRSGSLTSRSEIPLNSSFEHGVMVFEGEVSIDGEAIVPGRLAYMEPGRSNVEFSTSGSARALLVGGVPWPEPIKMWWNFVGRTWDEMEAARTDWEGSRAGPADSQRFGPTGSKMDSIPAPPILPVRSPR